MNKTNTKELGQMFLAFALTFIATLTTYGQNESPNIPIDSLTNKISYTEVVFVDSLSNKQELYSRAREWFAKAYKSSTNVIQMEDKESGKIVGKALMQVYAKALGTNHPSGYINYTISVDMKDGRYKYEVTNFYHTGQPGSNTVDYGACEKMINSNDKSYGVSLRKGYNYWLTQMDDNIKDLIIDLKVAMATKAKNVNKDDW